jgi:hypothetical protein
MPPRIALLGGFFSLLYPEAGRPIKSIRINPFKLHLRSYSETDQRLRHGVHLIIVRTIRESRTFLDKVIDPRGNAGIRQINVSSFNLGTRSWARTSLPRLYQRTAR